MSQNQLFAGICFHVQMDGENYDRAKEIRAILQKHGAQYSANPGDPRCTIIIAFPPPGAERGIPYRYTGDEPPSKGVWDYAQICIQLGRRSLNDRPLDPEALKRRHVVWSEWVEDCLKQNKVLLQDRYGGWEIITKDRAPRPRAIVPPPPPPLSAPFASSVRSVPSPVPGPSGHFTPPGTPSILGVVNDTSSSSFEIEPCDSASQTHLPDRSSMLHSRANQGVFAPYSNHALGPHTFFVASASSYNLIKKAIKNEGGIITSLEGATFVVFQVPVTLADKATIGNLRRGQKPVSEKWIDACSGDGGLVPIEPFLLKPNSTTMLDPTRHEPPTQQPDQTIQDPIADPVSAIPSPLSAHSVWTFAAFANRTVTFASTRRPPSEQAAHKHPRQQLQVPPQVPRPIRPSASRPNPNQRRAHAPLCSELKLPSNQRVPEANISVTPLDPTRIDGTGTVFRSTQTNSASIPVFKDPRLADKFERPRLLAPDMLIEPDETSTPSENHSDAESEWEAALPRHLRARNSIGSDTMHQIESGSEAHGTGTSLDKPISPFISPSPIAGTPLPFEAAMNGTPAPSNNNSLARYTPPSGLQAAISKLNTVNRSPQIKLPGIKRKQPKPPLPGTQAQRRTSQSLKEAFADRVSEAVQTSSLPKRPIIVRDGNTSASTKGKGRESVPAPKAPTAQPRPRVSTSSEPIVIDEVAPVLLELEQTATPHVPVGASDASSPRLSDAEPASPVPSLTYPNGLERAQNLVRRLNKLRDTPASNAIRERPGLLKPSKQVAPSSTHPKSATSPITAITDSQNPVPSPTTRRATPPIVAPSSPHQPSADLAITERQISIPSIEPISEPPVAVKIEAESTSDAHKTPTPEVSTKRKRKGPPHMYSAEALRATKRLRIDANRETHIEPRSPATGIPNAVAGPSTPVTNVASLQGDALKNWRLNTIERALRKWIANDTCPRTVMLSQMNTQVCTNWPSFYKKHRGELAKRIPRLEAVSKSRTNNNRHRGPRGSRAPRGSPRGKREVPEETPTTRKRGSTRQPRARPPVGWYNLMKEITDDDYSGEDSERDAESDEEDENSTNGDEDKDARVDEQGDDSDEDDLTPLPNNAPAKSKPRLDSDQGVTGASRWAEWADLADLSFR